MASPIAEPTQAPIAGPSEEVSVSAVRPPPDQAHDLPWWRERILRAVLRTLAGFGLLAYLPSVAVSVIVGAWPIAIIDTAVYAWVLALWRHPGWSFRHRAGQLLVLFYLLASVLLTALGPAAAGPLWLLAFGVLTAALFGKRAGFLALGLNALTLAGVGGAAVLGVTPWAFDAGAPVMLWVVIGVNLLYLNGVVSWSVAVMLEGLELTHAALRRETEHLESALGALHAETEERARLAQQVRRSERLLSLGTLAGGLGHDLNNQLVPIMTYSEMLLGDIQDAEMQEDLRAILQAATRAQHMVQQLMTFSRQVRQCSHGLDLAEHLRGLRTVVEQAVGPDIAVQLETPPGPVAVVAPAADIERIVAHLAANARIAMPDGGALRLELSGPLDVHKEPHPATLVAPAGFCRLRVQDTGPGVAPHAVERIFEPYFTTWAQKGHRGMGLAEVHGLLTGFGGAIEVGEVSSPGACFDLYVPCVGG